MAWIWHGVDLTWGEFNLQGFEMARLEKGVNLTWRDEQQNKYIFELILAIKLTDQDQNWYKLNLVCFGDVLRDRKFVQDCCLMMTFTRVKWKIFGLVIAIKFSDQDQIWCKYNKVCFRDVLRDRKFDQYQGLMIEEFSFGKLIYNLTETRPWRASMNH